MSKLTLMAYESLVESQGLYSRQFVDDITANHESYTHTINAVGGFDSASFTLKGTRDYLDDWYDDGLLRRICLINPEGIVVWEGFVNRLAYNISSHTKTKTIDNMYNRVYMRYSPLDISVFPPIAGEPITAIFDDPASQLKYGIKAASISGGERVDSTVYDWARTVLKNQQEIKGGDTVNTQSGDVLTMSVECKGYYHALKWLPYISYLTGYVQAHQVIQEILNYYNLINQGWISQDFGWLFYNFRTARRGNDDLTSCWDVIANIIKEGGKGGERWVGGLYQNRQMVYKPAEDIGGLYGEEFELIRALNDPGQMIYDAATGTEVKPWDMVPDKILHTTDLNIGGEKDLMYIEQVTFTEPYGLALVGDDDQRLSVYLTQRGLPSI